MSFRMIWATAQLSFFRLNRNNQVWLPWSRKIIPPIMLFIRVALNWIWTHGRISFLNYRARKFLKPEFRRISSSSRTNIIFNNILCCNKYARTCLFYNFNSLFNLNHLYFYIKRDLLKLISMSATWKLFTLLSNNRNYKWLMFLKIGRYFTKVCFILVTNNF
jgi:hypothetical protein